MERETNWFRFGVVLLLGIIGFAADILALLSYASGGFEIPSTGILNNPLIISAVTLAMAFFTVSILAFAFLEFSRTRINQRYSGESRHRVLLKGTRTFCRLVGAPVFFVWLIATLTMLWSSAPELPEDVRNFSLAFPASLLLLIVTPFLALGMDGLLSGWILEIHYFLND